MTLTAEAVSRGFGSVTVVDGVSLEVDAGTFAALLGPNGSGKTTLLRVLAGVLEPDEGTIACETDAPRQIGYMPQRPSFRPGFTAAETLDIYTALVPTDDDTETLLDRVGLADAGDRRIEALSGGMTRLLGLAQATVGDPPVVLLDEPASGLDPQMGRRTFEVARALADDGAAVLCSSHDLALVEEWCDRALVLDGGELVADDTPAALRDRHDATDLWAVFDAVVGGGEQVDVLGVTA
jgi:ABC-type multidrug transport system ATPase subunit